MGHENKGSLGSLENGLAETSAGILGCAQKIGNHVLKEKVKC